MNGLIQVVRRTAVGRIFDDIIQQMGAGHLLYVRTKPGTGDTGMEKDGPPFQGTFYLTEKETYKQGCLGAAVD